jgi:hypothetical protein
VFWYSSCVAVIQILWILWQICLVSKHLCSPVLDSLIMVICVEQFWELPKFWWKVQQFQWIFLSFSCYLVLQPLIQFLNNLNFRLIQFDLTKMFSYSPLEYPWLSLILVNGRVNYPFTANLLLIVTLFNIVFRKLWKKRIRFNFNGSCRLCLKLKTTSWHLADKSAKWSSRNSFLSVVLIVSVLS